jgi:Fe-Mn family superoxide dismutase
MKHTLPALPYAMNALAPYLSQETLEFHYQKHHAAYVNKLNELIVGTSHETQTLEEIIASSNGGIYNNSAQVYNHTFYWESLAPADQTGNISPELKQAIEAKWQSIDAFKVAFNQCAMNTFGSGWAWLVYNVDAKSLELVSTSNAVAVLQGQTIPLLVADVWEHAYYVDYRNLRASYLDNFWHLVNWQMVSQRLANA